MIARRPLTVRPLRAPLRANRALRFARALAGKARRLAPARPAGLAAPARLEMIHRLGMGRWNGTVDVTFAPVDLRLAVSLRQSLELRLWLEARAAGTAAPRMGAPAHVEVSRGLDEGRKGLADEVAQAVGIRALATPPASGWEVRPWGASPLAGPVPVRAAGEVLLRVRVAGEGAVSVPVAMPPAMGRTVRERESERTVAELLARSATEREVFLKAVRVEARKEAVRTAAGRPEPSHRVEIRLRELLRSPQRAAAAAAWDVLPTAARAALAHPVSAHPAAAHRGATRSARQGTATRAVAPSPAQRGRDGEGARADRARTIPLARTSVQVFLRPLSPSLPREGGGRRRPLTSEELRGRPRPLTSGELFRRPLREAAASATAAPWRPLEQPVARTATAPSTPPAEQVRLLRAASEKKVSELVKTEVASALSAASAASRLSRGDVSRIADQVYSTLGRRLTVEKERRG